MPSRGHKGPACVAAGLQHHDLGVPVVVLGERVHLKVAEQSTEGDVLLLGDVLIAQHQHLVVKPRFAEFLSRLGRDVGQIDAGDLGADRGGERMDADGHGVLLERGVADDGHALNVAGLGPEVIGREMLDGPVVPHYERVDAPTDTALHRRVHDLALEMTDDLR